MSLTSALRMLVLGFLLASAWVFFGAASAHAIGLVDSVSETVEEATPPAATVIPQIAPATTSPVSSDVSHSQGSARPDLLPALTAPVSTVAGSVTAPVESITAPVDAAVAPVTNTVTDVVAPVTNTVTDVVAPVTNTVTDVVAPVTNTVTDVVANLGRDVTPIVEPTQRVAGSLQASTIPTEQAAPAQVEADSVPTTSAGVSIEVSAPDGSLPGSSVAQAAPVAAVSTVRIFDPVFNSATVQNMTQSRVSVGGESGLNQGLANAVSAQPAGEPAQPSPSAPVSSGSGGGSGSILRGGNDAGSGGMAVLPSSDFSLQLSGSRALFALSAGMPGSIALEHGFSPD